MSTLLNATTVISADPESRPARVSPSTSSRAPSPDGRMMATMRMMAQITGQKYVPCSQCQESRMN